MGSFPSNYQGVVDVSTGTEAKMGIDALLSILVYLVIVGLIFYCVWWFIGYVGVPEPFNKVIRVVLGLVALVIVLSLLLGMVGHPIIKWG